MRNILQVLCLARVNKGEVVITEDLQVTTITNMILLIAIKIILITIKILSISNPHQYQTTELRKLPFTSVLEGQV